MFSWREYIPLIALKLISGVALALVAKAGLAQAVEYEAKGNLESINDVGCIAQDEVKNTYSPADLYRASAECVRNEKYDRAVYLSAVAGVYARFDAMRVSDPTAAMAEGAVREKYMGNLSSDRQALFFKSLSGVASDSVSLEALCQHVRQLGPPAYYPSYMIQHGLQAFAPAHAKSGTVKEGFDAASSWHESLVSFLHCP